MRKRHPKVLTGDGRITHAELLDLVRYDAETGQFSPRVHRPGIRSEILGHRESNGYIRICIGYRRFQAHRLAWFYVTGVWPVGQIDHKDLNPSNNSFANLRLADPSSNSANKSLFRNNTSGFKGVSLIKSSGRWQASIRFNGRLKYLGSYLTPEEAHGAYAAEARRLQGEFARVA